MKKETVGKLSTDLLKSAPSNDHSAHEQMKEMLTDYEKNIHDAIMAGCKQYEGDFFVVVLFKKERLLQNVMRNYYFARQSCPTPQHEQVVYKYHRRSGTIEFVWVVPSLEACVTMVNEAMSVHPEERQLLQFVLDFRDGTLLRKAQEFNGETSHDAHINTGKEDNGKSRHTSSGIIIPGS